MLEGGATRVPKRIRIEEVRQATPELQEALARLLPQLNSTLPVPDMERLRRMIADPAVTLLVAKDVDEIVGTTTVIVYTTPFWIKARLDEVVVEASARGKGVGEALVSAALEIGKQRGAQVAELQSGRGPQREAAHRLYLKLGFKIRQTDVMRIELT
jgi:GNAT superfamily N-acetyltransferase